MNNSKAYFITGTDTNVGKTWASLALMYYFKQQGYSVAGMKPVATGCQWDGRQFKNKDALLLQENASIHLQYKEINTYAFEMSVAPHLANKENEIQLKLIVDSFGKLQAKVDRVIVEGAGGWLVPLSEHYDMSDLVIALDIPVILVVAIKLGCINHARLTLRQIQADGIECAGWIAMCLDSDMQLMAENIESISNRTSAPLLGVLPFTEKLDVNYLASKINL
ncbi:MAG: dethiobiotin synthase [Methylococcales symbiont of Iophon sp. n. MRB-2018]|nr:MAG: dethiobiotin synthase [Methylococcales symbiont of Iophon sp. n. MRB-2018]KAF3978963.1 MAG: dethiobiotin synthase [Methylococcales symbiont of Iophon sp. n. MRB-2018]